MQGLKMLFGMDAESKIPSKLADADVHLILNISTNELGDVQSYAKEVCASLQWATTNNIGHSSSWCAVSKPVCNLQACVQSAIQTAHRLVHITTAPTAHTAMHRITAAT
jgi:hypothetical protein